MMKLQKPPTNISSLHACFMLLAISVLFSPTIVYAAECKSYYVAKTGNDTNLGTETSPFLTIRKGMMTMGACSKLLIKAGTYTEQLDSNHFTMPTGTSWEDAPVIKAFPGDIVTIQPMGGASVINLAHSYIKYMIFEGLVLDAINGVADIGSAISLTNGANHVRFLNIEAKNATLNVVLISRGTGGTNYNEFIGGSYHHSDVRVSPNNPKGAYIFYVMTDHNLFDGLDIHDAQGYGISIWNSAEEKPGYNTIRNCRVHGNNIKKASHAGILLGTGISNKAYNNLVYKNHGDGIQVIGGATDTEVYNNTFYKNEQEGIEIGDPWSMTTNTIIKNNISYGNHMSNYRVFADNTSGTIEVNNSLDGTNPFFFDAENNDFHLNPESPAIDAGLTLAEVNIDIDGLARPQGIKYDLGALEFNQSTVGAPKNFRILTAR